MANDTRLIIMRADSSSDVEGEPTFGYMHMTQEMALLILQRHDDLVALREREVLRGETPPVIVAYSDVSMHWQQHFARNGGEASVSSAVLTLLKSIVSYSQEGEKRDFILAEPGFNAPGDDEAAFDDDLDLQTYSDMLYIMPSEVRWECRCATDMSEDTDLFSYSIKYSVIEAIAGIASDDSDPAITKREADLLHARILMQQALKLVTPYAEGDGFVNKKALASST